MRKKLNNKGFTMAELLVVVGIIIILAGVGFIAVQNHQRSMAQLERNAIAKEIYFAAQNHLAMAESQGYLGATEFGTEGTAADDQEKNIYYVVNNGTAPAPGSMLDLMLPFASIDETVRSGGSYLIRYQADPAIVLDVFYCSVTGRPEKFNHTIASGEYATFMGYKESGMPRNGYVAGHYGGADAGLIGDYNVIQPPEVIVENGDRLVVKVKDMTPANAQAHDADGELADVDTCLELILTGETKDNKTAKAVILLKKPTATGTSFTPNKRVQGPDEEGYYTVVLDDITSAPFDAPGLIKDGMHFADLNGYSGNDTGESIWFMADPANPTGAAKPLFRPGEDITVEAVAFSNTTFTNIAYSSARTTNSLFADSVSADGTADHASVQVASFRHLENLAPAVSELSTDFKPAAGAQLEVRQVENLDWTAFKTAIAEGSDAYAAADEVVIYKKGEASGTAAGCFLPVNVDYALAYDAVKPGDATAANDEEKLAACHTITGLKADTSAVAEGESPAPAGLFGEISTKLAVRNLELVDFDVKGSGSAGALAGKLTGSASAKIEISNVLAHNSDDFDAAHAAATIVSTKGSAGGLVGEMSDTDVNLCAAALIVSSDEGSAGGLVGKSNGGSVKASYAGGHTEALEYIGTADGEKHNITGATSAGGLIGEQGSTSIENSYSTCSVYGATAGGLVGTAGAASSSIIKNSYATGLVHGATAGAFAGTKPTTVQGCWYYEIVNERTDATTQAISCLPPVPGYAPEDATEVPSGTTKLIGLKRLDATAAVYEAFSGDPAAWNVAAPYDEDLTGLYYRTVEGEKVSLYNLQTVKQLGATVTTTATASAPESFVAKHYGDWPAPELLVVNTK